MTHYDLAVIGSGSGNMMLGPQLAHLRVALIDESSTFGGTCLNVGCIPTKMFVYSAEVAGQVRDAARFGVDAELRDVRWRDIRDRIFGRIDPKSAASLRYREKNPMIDVFRTHADFVDSHTLQLGTGQSVTADQIVIAAGSRATVPPVIADSGATFHTSDTIMRLDEVPRRLAIVGGGHIASEFAHIFAGLGSEVTLILRGTQLLSSLDHDIATRFTELAEKHWNIRRGVSVSDVKEAGDELTLTLSDGTTVAADTLLVATGRAANGDRLQAAAAGVQLHSDGRVVVDEFQRTTAAGVWALGDVSSAQQLKHVANRDAKTVAHNLLHPDSLITSRHDVVPSAVFSDPQVAVVGLTERQAREQRRDIQVLNQPYSHTAYGWALEDTTSFCKLVVESGTGLLLGAHILGPQASTLIQPLIQAIEFGQTVLEVARRQYWIHPALTEVVENALLQFTE